MSLTVKSEFLNHNSKPSYALISTISGHAWDITAKKVESDTSSWCLPILLARCLLQLVIYVRQLLLSFISGGTKSSWAAAAPMQQTVQLSRSIASAVQTHTHPCSLFCTPCLFFCCTYMCSGMCGWRWSLFQGRGMWYKVSLRMRSKWSHWWHLVLSRILAKSRWVVEVGLCHCKDPLQEPQGAE